MTAAAPRRARAADPATQYARDVVAGREIACLFVRQACERHLRDLDEGGARGLRWNRRAAQQVIDFFPLLEHTKGRWAHQPLRLEPWQAFIVGSCFGWQRYDDEVGAWVRRFRYAYVEIPRKNGKSTVAAGVGNYLAFFDGEEGAEVYAAATKRDQAKIVWLEAKKQVQALRRKSESARARLRVLTNNLHDPVHGQKYEPLGADFDTVDGLNGHGFTIDELHAHKTRALWDVLEESMAARSQPLVFAITTAGWNRQSVCWEQHEFAAKTLEAGARGETNAAFDSYFAYIATLDDGDDWADESCWRKANPNLGVSVNTSYLRAKVAKALQTPGLVNSTKQKHFNLWTTGATRWLDVTLWDAMAIPAGHREQFLSQIAGKTSFGGLDLAGTTDLNAFLLIVPNELGGFDFVPRFWMPRDNVARRVREDHVPYDRWAADGWIELTDGPVRDDDQIVAGIESLCAPQEMAEIAVDPWQSPNIASHLIERGVEVVKVAQTFAALAGASEELEKLLALGNCRHDGNPVMSWMVGNAVADVDAAGNRKPSKEDSQERIDGMAALVTGLTRALLHVEKPPAGPGIFV